MPDPQIYKTLESSDNQTGRKTDLLLICGDFQAIRYNADLHSLAVPQKYRQLGDFHKYYSGQSTAPVLTIIIGGNHEASNYMFELFHGGWVAPNIYFLGHAGSVIVNGLKIAGASGIYKQKDYKMGYPEAVPYDNSTIRSIYHTRQYNVVRLSMLARSRPDIFLSHDWPLGIEQHGDIQGLLRAKPFFKEEVQQNSLGSPPLMGLLKTLRPAYWFAAHLHVKFAALYKHDGSSTNVAPRQQRSRQWQAQEEGSSANVAVQANPEEIDIEIDEDAPEEAEDLASAKKAALALLGSDEDEVDAKPLKAVPRREEALNEDEIVLDLDADDMPASSPTTSQVSHSEKSRISTEGSSNAGRMCDGATKFLALSKCGHRMDFMQFIDIETPEPHSPPHMTFDPLWLAVLKAFNYRMSSDPWNGSIPEGDMPSLERELEESICWVKTHVKDEGRLSVEEVQKFSKTAPSTQDYVDKSEPRTRTPLSHSESDRLILSGSHDFLQPANPSSVRSSGNREPNTSRGVGEIT